MSKKYQQLADRVKALEAKVAEHKTLYESLLGVTTSAVHLATALSSRVEVLEQRPGEITAEPYHR